MKKTTFLKTLFLGMMILGGGQVLLGDKTRR